MHTLLTFNDPYFKIRLFRAPRASDFDVPEALRPAHNSMVLYMLEWMTLRRFFSEVTVSDIGEITARISEEAQSGNCPYAYILKYNLRTLAEPEARSMFLDGIQDTDTNTGITDYINLITTLGTMYPETLINIIVNKVYRSVSAISYGVPDDAWVDTHIEHPYLWVVMYMNILANRHSDPRLIM